jgi:hypothetical protein
MIPAVDRGVIGLVIIGVFAVAPVVVARADRPGDAAAGEPHMVPDRFIRMPVPRPRRPPANGPNVTTAGPRLGPWQDIPRERGRPVDPAPGAGRFFFQMNAYTDGGAGGGRLVSVALDASGPDQEVLSLPGRFVIDHVRCATGTRLPCAVQMRFIGETRPGALPDERYQNFLVDGDAEAPAAPPRRLQGRASSGAELAGDVPVSPDGAFVALGDWRPTGRPDEPKHPRLLFYTRAGAPAATVELGKAPIHVLGWRGQGRALRAVVRAGWPSDHPPADHLEIDPRTGGKRRLAGPPEEDVQVSHDGRYRAVCRAERAIVITERATRRERTFDIPPDDQGRLPSGCPRWVSARYLAYTGATLAGFLDAETMKANDAFGAEVRYVKFTSDLRFAVASDGRRREMVAPVINDAAGPR